MAVVATRNNKRSKRTQLEARVEEDGDGSRQLLINGESLMGLAEVAEALGVRVQNIQHVPGLPSPVGKIRASRIWLASEVNEFAAKRQRRKAIHGR